MPALEHNPEGNHVLPPDEYIRQNFEPSDRLAVLVLNRENGRRVQRVVTAQALATEPWQRWLRHENAIGGDIYISQNALRENTQNRKKEDIAAIRHVYLDLDQDGAKSLAAIEASPQVPTPSYVVTSSPGKYQVIWKVEGMTQDEAEALQRRMVHEFGADPAATDSSRVLRLPGFINKKYEQAFKVVAEARSARTYRFEDFKLSQQHAQTQAARPASQARQEASPSAKTQSERDWRWAIRRAEQGEPIESIIETLRAYRDDKANPDYYARRTITRAYAKVALSRGAEPEEVIRTISAHPPRQTMNGEQYARAVVEEFQEKLGRVNAQGQPAARTPMRVQHSQQLGFEVMP